MNTIEVKKENIIDNYKYSDYLGINKYDLDIYTFALLNNQIYYIKRGLDKYAIINELALPRIYNHSNMAAANNIYGVYKDEEVILSPVYCCNGIKNIFLDTKTKWTYELTELDNFLNDKLTYPGNKERLREELIKMIALDYLTSQEDRHYDNFKIGLINGEYTLLPLFDFEMSMNVSDEYCVSNNYFKLLSLHFKKYAKLYPDFVSTIKNFDIKYLDVIFSEIEKYYNLNIESEYIQKYFDVIHDNKAILQMRLL